MTIFAKRFIPGPVITRYVKCYVMIASTLGERHLTLTRTQGA